MKINFSSGTQFSFLFFKRAGQIMRFLHLKFPFIKAYYFLKLFNQAETHYKRPGIFRFPLLNRMLINRIDFDKLAASNKVVFEVLLKKLLPWTPKRFQDLNFNPFGFFLTRPDRDTLLRQLRSKSIFCPIHWQIPEEAEAGNNSGPSQAIARECFTIPFSYPMTMELDVLLSTIDETIINKQNLQYEY